MSAAGGPAVATGTAGHAEADGSEGAGAGQGAGGGHVARVARGGAANLAGAVLAAVATFAFTVVVTRSLSRADAGVFFSLTSAFVIAYAVARLGVPTGLVYFIARYRATGQQHRLRPVVRQALLAVCGVAGLLGIAGVLTADSLAAALTGDDSAGTVTLVRLLSVCLVFAALTDVGAGATRGFGVMRPVVLVDRLARPLVQLALALLVVGAGAASTVTVGAAWVLPFVPAAVVLLWWSARLRGRATDRHAPGVASPSARTEVRDFWRFTAPRSLASVAQMALQRSDIVLLGVLRGPEEAAVYAAATRFLVFGQLGAGAISTTIQPRLAGLIANRRWPEARLVYRVATLWLVLLAWPVYLTFAVLAPELLSVFGEGYRVGAVAIVLLSLTMLVATGCGAVDVVLAMAGRTTWTMANSLAALGLNIVLNLLLIPAYGLLGAAIAWSAAILLNNLLPLAQLGIWMRLHPLGRSSVSAAALAAVCFGVLPGAARLLTGSPVVVVAAVVTGAVAYAAVAWRLRDLFELGALVRLRRSRAGGPRQPGGPEPR